MSLLNRTIKFFIICLFFVTPLIFSFSNSELFEIPKMHFIYFITVIIITLHLINWALGHIQIINKIYLNWFILIFLVSQIICTITSIDIYTSIHGYYSRINGGLISIATFSALFFILPLYFDQKFKKNLIDSILISGFLVSIYGILEHFGIDKNLWVQDVQSRVFSTLGQPNWLAAYLCVLLPFSVYNYLNSSNKKSLFSYFILSTLYFLAILFTKSKSGLAAVVISLIIFFALYFFKNIKKLTKAAIIKSSFIFLIFILLSITVSNPVKDYLFPKKSNNLTSENLRSDILITSSEDIRKIVWQGSLELFKKFPILGTGVETFAYSYYWTRPIEHNLTSEWDFLYNKAHNEYLNYLATTGLVGTIPYLLLILSIIFYLVKISKIYHLPSAILCSFTSILITNAAGFSISVISLFFFVLPCLVFETKPTQTNQLKIKKFLIPIIIISSIYILKQITSSYLSDILYSQSKTKDNQQNYQSAYNLILQAHTLHPKEPNFYIETSLLAAKMAVITKNQDYIDQAIKYADMSVNISPANINFWKQRSQVYYYLSSLDQNYFPQVIESMIQASKLAPTDAKIDFNLGQFLETASLNDEAIIYYQKAIDLKPNYDHAYFALAQIYYDQKKYDLAKENLEPTLKYAPSNAPAQKMLNEISKIQQ